MLRMNRLVTVVVVAIALVIALFRTDFVLAFSMFAWAAMCSTILVPYVFGLFWKRGTAKAAWISGISGFAAAVIWFFVFRFRMTAPLFTDARGIIVMEVPLRITLGSIHEFIVSQVVSLVAFPVASLLTKPPRQEFVNDVFSSFKMQRRASN